MIDSKVDQSWNCMTRRALPKPALAEQSARILVSSPTDAQAKHYIDKRCRSKFLVTFKLKHCRHSSKMSEETEAPVASSEPQARHIVYCGGAKPFWSRNTSSVE